MSTPSLLGVHQPGTTLLHRMPVGPKLAALAAASIAVVLVRDLRTSVAFLVGALVVATLGRIGLRSTARAGRPVLVTAVLVAALQWWTKGAASAAGTLLDLLTLALLALTVTVTTAPGDLLDAVVRWARPLRRVGVPPERMALAVGLAVQSVPTTVALALETRDAARARGLERNPRVYLTPFVIRVVARAHETGDALHARGLGDEDPPPREGP